MRNFEMFSAKSNVYIIETCVDISTKYQSIYFVQIVDKCLLWNKIQN